MSPTLTPGANAALNSPEITVRIRSGADIDTAAYRLAANGKVRGDGDMIFYGQIQSQDTSIRLEGNERESRFQTALNRQPAEIETIAFAFSGNLPLSQLGSLILEVEENGRTVLNCPVDIAGRSEKALILGECYRRNGAWKFRFIAQGFNGGLKPLSEHFGVEIADDAPAANPPPAPSPSRLSLSKITLDKQNTSVSLAKKDDFGQIKINLNWNRGQNPPAQSGGFLKTLFGGNKGIDLDLGAFIRLKNGQKDCVQALGNTFGALDRPPYVLLRGDDRTGSVADGEWMEINGRRWAEIDEVLVYAFIYEGVPNWDATDGIVTLYVNQQQIETRLTEGAARRGMCAVARLINQNGGIQVERINRYFGGHEEMDRAFGWGFRWRAGSK
ncbi:MAG: TerD family protein [Neisseria sp.]|nr:TerD family protein [Neisseria sp.]